MGKERKTHAGGWRNGVDLPREKKDKAGRLSSTDGLYSGWHM